MSRQMGVHEFWFGTTHGPLSNCPRCSCGWSGEPQADLTQGVLHWLTHLEWATKPGVKLQADVWIDDAAFSQEPA